MSEAHLEFLAEGARKCSRVVCPGCDGSEYVRLGHLENVWYFACALCGRDFRISYEIEDVPDHFGRL